MTSPVPDAAAHPRGARANRRRAPTLRAWGRAVALVTALALASAGALACGDDAQTRSIVVPTRAMEPTIKAGQTVSVDVDAYRDAPVQRGDVVLFMPTPSARMTCNADPADDAPFIQRVVGVAGDRVRAADGALTVDGTPFAIAVAPDYDRDWPIVGEGNLLVLGDNTPASCDSHLWPEPFVPVANILGKVRI